MINKDELVASVAGSELNSTLFQELIEQHISLTKSFHRKDYEKTLNKTGKFTETVFQLLEELLSDGHSTQPRFSDVQDKLENQSKGSIPESIRKILPRIARYSLYTIRSERGAVHKDEINPQMIDAYFAHQTTKWVISEFIRVYGTEDIDVEELRRRMEQVSTRSLPFVEEFEGGDIMILIDNIKTKDKILLVLYHFYPERVTRKDLYAYIDDEDNSTIRPNLHNANDQKHVHENDDGAKLTRQGRLYVEENYGTELTLQD